MPGPEDNKPPAEQPQPQQPPAKQPQPAAEKAPEPKPEPKTEGGKVDHYKRLFGKSAPQKDDRIHRIVTIPRPAPKKESKDGKAGG